MLGQLAQKAKKAAGGRKNRTPAVQEGGAGPSGGERYSISRFLSLLVAHCSSMPHNSAAQGPDHLPASKKAPATAGKEGRKAGPSKKAEAQVEKSNEKGKKKEYVQSFLTLL